MSTAQEEYCVVRFGEDLMDEDGHQWRPIVHRCPQPGGVISYRVCLHGGERTVLVEHFDVHCGRYANEAEQTSVALSAIGHACEVAWRLEQLYDWQLKTMIQRRRAP